MEFYGSTFIPSKPYIEGDGLRERSTPTVQNPPVIFRVVACTSSSIAWAKAIVASDATQARGQYA
ncbi:hypothetical protein NEOLEDRAFT_1128225 [Neolentinus lepideus HHB14362 ss-1]|uniref:Uncharacterized protein n=1 Tax=Neolentinus lepideus HHB14362 ss-1 TaxID=1314782 RepID=A0A165VC40_9AGAM|nr:hypothetical protein NEOLEDRAFT_1128225 [Neolentinus lepideus HHB14362 ss-1]